MYVVRLSFQINSGLGYFDEGTLGSLSAVLTVYICIHRRPREGPENTLLEEVTLIEAIVRVFIQQRLYL